MLRKALAAYRLTHLFVHEDGPFSVFDWIRYKAGVTVEQHTLRSIQDGWMSIGETAHADGFWAELLVCPLCLSVWFAAIVHFLPDFILDWLAVAGVCLLFFKRFPNET